MIFFFLKKERCHKWLNYMEQFREETAGYDGMNRSVNLFLKTTWKIHKIVKQAFQGSGQADAYKLIAYDYFNLLSTPPIPQLCWELSFVKTGSGSQN